LAPMYQLWKATTPLHSDAAMRRLVAAANIALRRMFTSVEQEVAW
jgi:hypothetical protein